MLVTYAILVTKNFIGTNLKTSKRDIKNRYNVIKFDVVIYLVIVSVGLSFGLIFRDFYFGLYLSSKERNK